MIKTTTAAIAAAAMLMTLPAAAGAQAWQPMSQRKANLERRIEVGVRNGSLTRVEASRLKTRFANLQRLEWRYQRNGLTYRERTELDNRYIMLSNAIANQRHDRQVRKRYRGR